MKKELVLKECKNCGTIVEVLKMGESPECCKEARKSIKPNSVDCAVEKHMPTYEMVEDEIFVKVNHIMEKDHYIKWIFLVYDNKEIRVELYPEQEAQTRLPYIKGSTLYAYCNKHGLWKKEIE